VTTTRCTKGKRNGKISGIKTDKSEMIEELIRKEVDELSLGCLSSRSLGLTGKVVCTDFGQHWLLCLIIASSTFGVFHKFY
jgi:hypothetical protein